MTSVLPRLPCYTEAELRAPDGPNLPGLWEPAKIDLDDPYAFFRGTDWQPVLNLAVVADSTKGKTAGLCLLAGSRPESEPTHPNVVSTPTQWITDRSQLEVMLEAGFLYSALLSSNEGSQAVTNVTPTFHLNEINPSRPVVIAKLSPLPQVLGGVNLPIGRFAQKLLAEKLGFESWYAPENSRRLAAAHLYPSIGAVSLSRLVAGFSYVGDTGGGEPLYEPIVMLGTVMHTPFPRLFPRRTARYDNLTFTPLDGFSDNVQNRAVGNLIWTDSEAEEIMMCVRGLCLSTSAAMSVDPDIVKHASSFDLNVRYSASDIQRIRRLLDAANKKGEELARQTAVVLGSTAFAGERVRFVRTLSRGGHGRGAAVADISPLRAEVLHTGLPRVRRELARNGRVLPNKFNKHSL